MCARSVERLSLAAHTLLSIEFTLEGDWEVCRVGKVLLQQWLPHSMLRKKKKKTKATKILNRKKFHMYKKYA